MRVIISTGALIFFFCISLFAQPGFNKWYDFDTTGVAFHSIFYDVDTITITGTALDLEANQWGTLFLKMDTLGNIYNHRLHLDPAGGQYAFASQYQTSKTINGHFLITGVFFFDERYFIMELDNQGEIILFKDFEWNNNIISAIPQKLMKIEDGYLLFSRKQTSDYKIKVAITKLDQEGNILWEELYGIYFGEAGLISVSQQDDNTYIIGAAFGNLTALDQEDQWARTWIFAVDSLGTIRWDWKSEQAENEHGAWGIQHLDNGDWMYATRSFHPLTDLDFYYTPKVVRRDSNFNLLWEYELTASQADDNEVVNLMPSPDGQWIGAGWWILPNSFKPFDNIPDDDIYFAGCLYKLTEHGDSIWLQCDTAFVEGGYGIFPRLNGMVVLPSGSTVAVGRVTINDGTSRSAGWVIKRDQYGCMEELCLLTGVEDLEQPTPADLKVYPNPAHSRVTFEWDGVLSRRANLLIFDAMGRRVQEVALNSNSYQWDTSSVPNGIYFYQLRDEGHILYGGRLLIQH
jgi:hypothetical protein